MTFIVLYSNPEDCMTNTNTKTKTKFSRIVATDTETYPIRDGLPVPKLVCGTFAERTNIGIETSILLSERATLRFLGLLRDPNVLIVGHNVYYEVFSYYRYYTEFLGKDGAPFLEALFRAVESDRLVDTGIIDSLVKIGTQGYPSPLSHRSLKVLSKGIGLTLEGKAGVKAWRLRYNELDGVPLKEWPKEALDYALLDAEATLRVFEYQVSTDVLTKGPLSDVYSVVSEGTVSNLGGQMRTALSLRLMSLWGLTVDSSKVLTLKDDVSTELLTLKEVLLSKGLLRESGTVDTHILRTLVSTAYDGDPPRTEKGSIRYDKSTLKGAPSLTYTLAFFNRYKYLEKLLSTYLKPLLSAAKEGHNIHPSYDLPKKTGRSSSYRPNIQNQGRKSGIRPCFKAPDGYYLVSADYDCQELRSWAQAALTVYGIESKTLARFKEDPTYDPHISTAVELLREFDGVHLTYEEALSLKGTSAKVKARRQQAKAANFGFPGGMGITTFIEYAKGYGITLTEDSASRVRQAWLSSDPGHGRYLREVSLRTRRGNASFLQPYSGRVRADCGYTELANTAFQGLAADGGGRAAYLLSKRCYSGDSPLRECRPIAYIHDEFLVLVPKSSYSECTTLLVETLTEGMSEFHPDVPISVGVGVSTHWFKDAESVVLEDGTYSVWRP